MNRDPRRLIRSAAARRAPVWHVGERLAIALLIAVYYGILVAIYKLVICRIYSYEGLVDRPLPGLCWVILALLAISPALVIDVKFRRPSVIVSWIMYLTLVVPCCYIPALTMSEEPVNTLWVSVSIVVNFIIFELLRSRDLFKLPAIPGSQVAVRITIPVVVLVFCFLLFAMSGFRIDMTLGAAMYERRAEAAQQLQTFWLSGYMLSILVGVGIPFVFGYAIGNRRLFSAFVGVVSIVAVVSFNGTRSTLLFPFLCFGSIWAFTRKRLKWLYLLGGLTFISVSVLFSGSLGLIGVVHERMLSLPAQLTGMYYDLASTSPPLVFRDLAIVQLVGVRNPLGLDLPHYVATTYLHSPGENANANLWASAEVEWAVFGPLIATVLAALIARLLDSIVAIKNTQEAQLIGVGVCSYWALTWSNGALHTSILSNGVGVAMLLMFVVPGVSLPAIGTGRLGTPSGLALPADDKSLLSKPTGDMTSHDN